MSNSNISETVKLAENLDTIFIDCIIWHRIVSLRK